jgi:hypothetical protein
MLLIIFYAAAMTARALCIMSGRNQVNKEQNSRGVFVFFNLLPLPSLLVFSQNVFLAHANLKALF